MSDKLSVGDIIQNNDPRMPGRRLEIMDFVQGHLRWVYAVCDTEYRVRTTINTRRIFTDGKKRRYGFNRVPK